MSEIGENPEIINIKPELKEFKNIKPEEGMTFREAQNFWDDFFKGKETGEIPEGTKKIEDLHEEIDGVKRYYDDNNNLYRVGNELKANVTYEINGYKYQTDERGRITSAGGKLRIKDREGRLPIKDSIENIGKGDEKETDDRGHLIGDQFDGSNGMENLVPQDADINRNDFKNFENHLANEVKSDKNVKYSVEPIYKGDSRRPDVFIVTYSIDGEKNIRIFPNGKGNE